MLPEPGGEVDAVEGRVGGVEAAEREGGAADVGLLREGEVRVGREAAGQVQRYGQGGAADASQAGAGGAADVQDGDVQAVLEGARWAASMRSRNQR